MLNKSYKTPRTTMDSFSGSSKFTETFFYYPTRNQHTSSHYENKNAKQPIKDFRTKAKSHYQSLMFESSLNPFSRNQRKQEHYQPKAKLAGDRKKQIMPHSNKQTDPITMTYQPLRRQNKESKPFESTIDYKKDIERKTYLPIERQLSSPKRHYHSQLGFSLQARSTVTPRPCLNNSATMRSTIQYTLNSQMNKPSCFDNFKYSSKK